MTGESLPRYLGLQSTISIGLAIVIIGFLVIIGTLVTSVLNPELFAAVLQRVLTVTLGLMRNLLRF